MSEELRANTADLIAYGIVGSLLDAAYDVLVEVDDRLATDLLIIMNTVMDRFHYAEKKLFRMEGLNE